MKRLEFIIPACVFLFLNFSCQTPESGTTTAVSGSIELIVEPGDRWQGKMKVFIFSIKKTPQIAAWIEDTEGRYIATITVTNRSAHKKWRGAPAEGRPEALPVWNHRQQSSALNDIDTVSAATPKGPIEASVDRGALIDGNVYNVFLEINHSFDYNDRWTKDNSGDNGQPSLIYHGQFMAGQPFHIPLVPVGYGSVDGSSGDIGGGLENFSTALNIIKDVYIIRK